MQKVTATELESALRRSRLFEGIPVEEARRIVRAARRIEYARGSHVWLEGDRADTFYVVVTGQVRLYRVGPDGEEVMAAVYAAGDHFGEFGLFAEALRMTSAEAVASTICLVVEREPLLDLLQRNPLVMRRMLRALSLVSRSQLDAFSDAAFYDLQVRVARKLLELADQRGEATSRGTRIGIKISQGDLAALIPASRPKVNRALGRLAANGLIEHRAGTFTLLDPGRLREWASNPPPP